MKKRSLALGILLGIAVVASLGFLYIDSVKHYWQFSGGFVRLVVNTNAQATITVDTNNLRVGINTNNNTVGTHIYGATPPADVSANSGTTANSSGAVLITAGRGGNTVRPTTAIGGIGGRLEFASGAGADAPLALTNATGGAGGSFTAFSGPGSGNAGGVATNSTTGGTAGSFSMSGGSGGSPSTPSTNTFGGAGGSFGMTGGVGGTPSAGWSRTGGNGGVTSIAGGAGGNGVRTNGGSGGMATFEGGQAGAGTTGGNAGAAGLVSIVGGAGATGNTNSDGAHVFIAGGAPGSGAVPGNVVLARTSAGTSRGAGVQIGPLIAGGSATITNVLGAAASLDFPLTSAGVFSDLPITVTGVTSNNSAVALSVPWESALSNGVFTTYASNDTIFVRFVNTQLVSPADPNAGTFSVVVFRIR